MTPAPPTKPSLALNSGVEGEGLLISYRGLLRSGDSGSGWSEPGPEPQDELEGGRKNLSWKDWLRSGPGFYKVGSLVSLFRSLSENESESGVSILGDEMVTISSSHLSS